MSSPPLARFTAVVSLVGSILLAAPSARASARALAAPSADVTAYQGLGGWVDIYDHDAFAQPEAIVRRMDAYGVRTLYLETANYRAPNAIMEPEVQGRFLEAAHARGIRVVAWYAPSFEDVDFDLARSLAAVRFRSAAGERFDSFAEDIEVSNVADPAERSARLLDLSRRLRAAVGPEYPLGAIIPSPRGMELIPTYWPGFPYRGLARLYEVFLPMAYSSFRAEGRAATYDYVARSVQLLREGAGATARVHMIGGISDMQDEREVTGFVRAVREFGLLGGSLYDFSTSTDEDWRALRAIAPNPVSQWVAPLELGTDLGTFGNLEGEDSEHPREVVFRTGRHTGPHELDYAAAGPGAAGVRLMVNWRPVATLHAERKRFGPRRTIEIPTGLLDHPHNVVAFVNDGVGFPWKDPWPVWGVRGATLLPPALAAADRGDHGYLTDGERSRGDRVTYVLRAASGILGASVQAFDVSGGDVRVWLNDTAIATLEATGPNDWGLPQTIVLPPELLHPDGTDRLTFDAVENPPTPATWGVRLLSVGALPTLPVA